MCYNLIKGGAEIAAETIKINGATVTFDKEKTENHRTEFNKPCDCQNCQNFYENIKGNVELVGFLSAFGLDYRCTEEVLSWDLGDDMDALIHSEGYYSVDGQIEGEDFSLEKFGVTVSFAKAASVPHDRTDHYFWIIIENDFPYILSEKRDLPPRLTRGVWKANLFEKFRGIFKKNP